MDMYKRLMQPIDATKPTEELLACALLADMAYVRNEIVLENAIKLYLGVGNFAWYETPGSLPVNYTATFNPDGVIVSFVGTENLSQFLYYVCTSLNISRDDLNLVRCHLGFGDIASDVLRDLRTKVPPNCRNAPITLVGHSLGGAVAQLIAAMVNITGEFFVKNIVTFGAPAVGADEFAALISFLHQVHVVNEGDPVPYLPPEVGIKWTVGATTPNRFLFYHFTPIFPWLLATDQGTYVRRNSKIANLPRSIIEVIWKILRDPNDRERTEEGKLLEAHLFKYYEGRMRSYLRRTGANINFAFFDQMFGSINSLSAPGQYAQEIPQTQFNSLVAALGQPQGLVAPPPPPPNPYIAFYGWCAGTRPDVTIEVGLYTNVLPPNEVKFSDIVEPKFDGYRRAGDDTWAKKQAQNNAVASAQTGQLTWVQSRATSLQTVRGAFVVMHADGTDTLVGAQAFDKLIEFGNVGIKVSMYGQTAAIYSAVTQTQKAKENGQPGVYSLAFMSVQQVGASAPQTTFNSSTIYPNDWQVIGTPLFGGGAGGERTWWEYRGEDRLMITKARDALLTIQKRDAKAILRSDPQPTIFNPYDEALSNSLQNVIDQLTFDLIVVHG